jgi:hypothetical protein
MKHHSRRITRTRATLNLFEQLTLIAAVAWLIVAIWSTLQ